MRRRLCLRILVLVGSALGASAPGPDFADIAKDAGLVQETTFGARDRKDYILETTGTGAAIFDFDGDGRNDIFIANGTRLGATPKESSPSQLYRNLGDGKFRDVSADAGLTQTGWAQAVCVADYDNDGKPDLLVTYYGRNRLYRNKGGAFEDVSAAALPAGEGWGAGCTFTDYDRDGFVDIFISTYVALDLKTAPKAGSLPECIWKSLPVMCGPKGLPQGKNQLLRNRGDGTFEDVSAKSGILKAGGCYGLGVVASDFNDDGWPDIYVACDQTPSQLFQNRRNGTFAERGIEAGVAYNFDGRLQAGMGVAVGDFNNDGRFDIAKTNFSGDLPSLYLNEDGEFFVDVSQRAGLGIHQLLGWGVAWVDVDEDGRKDLVMANGHVYPEVERAKTGDQYRQLTLLYRNLGDGKFGDITAEAGTALRQPRPSRGLATGDLDGDGHPEIVIVNMNEPPALLKNRGPRRNWTRIECLGAKLNRSAIGARVTVEAGGARQVDEVRSGSSYYSQNEFALHFGLGAAKAVDRIEVRWPDGSIQEWKNQPVNQTIRLTQNSKL